MGVSGGLCIFGNAVSKWQSVAIIMAALALGWPSRAADTLRQLPTLHCRLNADIGPLRPLEGRLQGFTFAPETSSKAVPSDKLLRFLQNARRTTVSSQEHAILELLAGRLSSASRMLERLTRQTPKDAGVRSDLAAVELELATSEGDPIRLIRALDAAAGALALDPALSEAWFNLALILEKIYWVQGARTAWDTLIASEPPSGWTQEADRRRRLLLPEDRQAAWARQRVKLDNALRNGDIASAIDVVQVFRQRARLYGEEELLSGWARSAGNHGPATAAQVLRSLEIMGDIIFQISGDAMLRDSVAVIRRARSEKPQVFHDLVIGHEVFSEGRTLFDEGRYQDALPMFAQAEQKLSASYTPFRHWATLYVTLCHYYAFDYKKVTKNLTLLQGEVETSSYPNLLGRILWIRGLTTLLQGDIVNSLRAYTEAAKYFRESGELGHLGAVERLIAQNLRYLGLHKQAWEFRLRALASLVAEGDRRRLQSLVQETATACLALNLPNAAVYFQAEALKIALRSRRPELITSALRRQAALFYQLGKDSEALKALQKASFHAAQVRDEYVRLSAEADRLVLESEILLEQQPGRALATLTRAVEAFDATDYHLHMAHLLLARARAREATGDFRGAESDLRRAVEEVEAKAKMIVGDEKIASFFGEEQKAFDRLACFLASRGRTRESFAAAERGRARALLTRLVAAHRASEIPTDDRFLAPVDAAAVQSTLTDDLALVEYLVIEDRVIIWVLTRKSIVYESIKLKAVKLDALVNEFRRAVVQGEKPRIERLAGKLYDLLFSPITARLVNVTKIVVVPSRSLSHLPFAALLDPKSGRFLVERYALGVSPSASVFAHSRMVARASREARSALVVGVSQFTSVDSLSFGDLPGALREARRVATLYRRATLLLNANATAGALRGSIDKAEIVHVATHALISSNSPEYSLLMLGQIPGAGSHHVLSGADLAAMKLSGTRLWFLSACGTGTGYLLEGEGTLSLATILLGAGVGSVVASQWRVDDTYGEELATRFHAYLSQGQEAIMALQAAQLDLVRSNAPGGRNPQNWAPFQIIGSGI